MFVEDHLYHMGELIAAMGEAHPDLASQMTVCAIDRGGPDTDATVTEWLRRSPALQIAAPVGPRDRVRPIVPTNLETAPAFATLVAGMLRPGGILVQDIQLSTLPFVPADRWWESIYTAATVRGLFADRAPIVRFLSNKRGYSATFGRDLLGAGFDPRDVVDKSELVTVGVSAIAGLFDRQFPLALDGRTPAGGRRSWRVADADRRDVEEAFDLVVWPSSQGAELGGRLVGAPDRRVTIRAGSHEAVTWDALVADRLADGGGVPVLSVGERVGPPNAERAELTNVAARHIHTLRGRLGVGTAIVTANHTYRLGGEVSVATAQRASGQTMKP